MKAAKQSKGCDAPVHPTHPKVLGGIELKAVLTLHRQAGMWVVMCWARGGGLTRALA